MARLKRHPLSELWGDMETEEFDQLVEDVRANGIRVPIMLYEGKVLDGWHRYKASEITGATCPRGDYQGDDPGGYVISHNLHRRHLTKLERAKRALAVRDWADVGSNQHRVKRAGQTDTGAALTAAAEARTKKQLAEETGVSESTVARAKRAIREDRGEVDAKKPGPPKLTRMEKLMDENEHLKAENERLQDVVDRVKSPPKPSSLEEETITLRKRLDSLLAEMDKEKRMHRIARQQLRQCMEARGLEE